MGRYFNRPLVQSRGKVAAIRGEGENERGEGKREWGKERRAGVFWNEAPVRLRLARTGIFPEVSGFGEFKVISVSSNAHNLFWEEGRIGGGYDGDTLTQAWTCSQRTGWMDGICIHSLSLSLLLCHSLTHSLLKKFDDLLHFPEKMILPTEAENRKN